MCQTGHSIIQPVSIVYDRLGGLPAGRASRPGFAWYGDMDIASHFWRLTQHIGLRATVLLHAPLDPAHFEDRKALSQAVWQVVADGADPAAGTADGGGEAGIGGSFRLSCLSPAFAATNAGEQLTILVLSAGAAYGRRTA